MSRAIKFRAWHKRHRCMMQASLLDFYKDGGAMLIDEKTKEEIAHTPFDEIELMQFTGFYDKHGKDVFFADILEEPGDGVLFPRNDRWLVEEDEDDFGVSLSPVGDYHSPWRKDRLKEKIAMMEIIGNRYEMPELARPTHDA